MKGRRWINVNKWNIQKINKKRKNFVYPLIFNAFLNLSNLKRLSIKSKKELVKLKSWIEHNHGKNNFCFCFFFLDNHGKKN